MTILVTYEQQDLKPNDRLMCINEYENRVEEIKLVREIMFPGQDFVNLLENSDLSEKVPEHIHELIDNQRCQEDDDDAEEGEMIDPLFASMHHDLGPEEKEELSYKTSNV